MIGSLLKVVGVCLVGLRTTSNNDIIARPPQEPQNTCVGISNNVSLRYDSYASYRLWLFLGGNSVEVTRNVTYYNTHLDNPSAFSTRFVGTSVQSSVPLMHISGTYEGYDVQDLLDDDNGAVYNFEVVQVTSTITLRFYKANYDDVLVVTPAGLSDPTTDLTIEPVAYLKEYLDNGAGVNIVMNYNIYDNNVYYPFQLIDGTNYPYFSNDREIVPVPPSDYPYGDNGLYGAFGLLYNAFSAVASVFMINILPGLTLGTLFVLPLVVLLIIFIVNLFKR